MARQARDRSELKVYHAILRGVNKQQIFECSEDYEHFVRILQRQCGLPVETRPSKVAKSRSYQDVIEGCDDVPSPMAVDSELIPQRHCYLYAWCLMGNHVHLLLKEADEPIGDVDVKPRKAGFEDEDVWQLLTQYSGAANASEFQALPRPMQKHYLYMVHEQGVGPRTLSRLTGVSYSVVYKATSAANEEYLQMLYKQMQAANMACEYDPEDEEWLTYVEEDEYARFPEY